MSTADRPTGQPTLLLASMGSLLAAAIFYGAEHKISAALFMFAFVFVFSYSIMYLVTRRRGHGSKTTP